MGIYTCDICSFSTPYKTRYTQHCLTNKHQKNTHNDLSKNYASIAEKKKSREQMEKNQNNNSNNEQLMSKMCQFCGKIFQRKYNLQRHESVCEINKNIKISPGQDFAPTNTNLHQEIFSNNCQHFCEYCQTTFSRQYTLDRHYKRCKALQIKETEKDREIQKLKMIIHENEKDKEIAKLKIIQEKEKEKFEALLEEKDKTIDFVQKSNTLVTNINHNNKTVNFLNNHYGEMIAMEKFLYNLEHHEQLTHQERNSLLLAYKENGIDVFSRSFSYIMKQNCKRQLMNEGKPDMKILPLFCSDGSLRSHKEKGKDGWKTHYDNKSINQMLNISNDQVYESHQEMICITGKERNRVYNAVKRDNHVEKMKQLEMEKKKELIK